MKYACSIFLYLFFQSLCLQAFSQDEDYYIRSYTVENGLPNNQVRCITQDKAGFLWFSTWDGLCRFDGNEFRAYYHDPDDSLSLPNINLREVHIDRDNNVWALAEQILCRYDRSKDHFIRYNRKKNPKDPDYIASDIIYDYSTDNYGNLWALGNQGFEKFDHVSRRFIHYPFVDDKGNILNTSDNKIVFDNLNNLWIIKKNQVVKCTVIANAYLKKNIVQPIKIYIFPFLEDKMIFNISYTFSIYNGRHGIWITSNNGLFLLKPGSNTFIRYRHSIPKNEFSFKHPIIWSSIPDGLFVYNPQTGKIFHPNPNLTQNVETYFIDYIGNIWFGSLHKNSQDGTGLNKIIFTGKFFKHYLPQTPTEEEVAVFGLYKDKNRDIWVGTNNYNYLIRIHPDGTFEKGNFLPDELVQLGSQPRTILEDNHGSLWIGYINGILFRYDYFRKTFERCHLKKYPYIQNKDDFLFCFKILNLDKKGNIWAGGDKGFLHFNSVTLTVDFYKQIIDDGIYSMLNDKEGNQWIGMTKSQLLFKGKDNKQDIQIYHIAGQYNIESIVEGDNHDLWLALLGGGICRFDKLTHQSKIYTTKDGLANNTTYNILKDKKGNLWISSNTGISRFNPRTGLFRNFSKSDGLKIVEFNADAACQTKEGEMLLGGMGGFVSFYPDSLDKKEKNNKTPLLFTGFKVSGRERYFNQPIYEITEIHLQKGDNNFEISFASVDFVNAEKIRYRYCLQGYKNEWISTDSRNRIVNYASLPPGRYTFCLQATDANGNWEKNASLQIDIPAYFYQTIWFKLIIILLILGIITLFTLMVIHQIKLTERRKQEQLKLEALRGQMNPHFLFNSLNSINYFISLNDRLSANKYISDFSNLMRAILDNSVNEYVRMDKEIEMLENYLQLEHLRFSEKFDYSIETDENINTKEIEIKPSMVQSFIENAIWHGIRSLNDRKGFVRVVFKQLQPDCIHCYVEDDGIGRNLAEKYKTANQRNHHSRGIGIINQRLKIINRMKRTNFKITMEDLYPDKEETGTRVIIEIPVR